MIIINIADKSPYTEKLKELGIPNATVVETKNGEVLLGYAFFYRDIRVKYIADKNTADAIDEMSPDVVVIDFADWMGDVNILDGMVRMILNLQQNNFIQNAVVSDDIASILNGFYTERIIKGTVIDIMQLFVGCGGETYADKQMCCGKCNS